MIAALFVRSDSIYKQLGIDCYDLERDALNYCGNYAVIAHPPCRAWSRLKHFARPLPGEKDLALFAVDLVRRVGGVLEHPKGSSLFKHKLFSKPGYYDMYGGYIIEIDQFWFGHKAQKSTWLYIVGCPAADLPVIYKTNELPKYVLSSSKERANKTIGYRPNISKKEREQTPIKLALWLIEVAEKCNNQINLN